MVADGMSTSYAVDVAAPQVGAPVVQGTRIGGPPQRCSGGPLAWQCSQLVAPNESGVIQPGVISVLRSLRTPLDYSMSARCDGSCRGRPGLCLRAAGTPGLGSGR